LQTVQAAAAAGFDAVGIWIEPAQWSPQTTREVRRAVSDNGLRVLDAEVIWIRPGPLDPGHLRAIDIAAEIGAANVLVVSSDPDRAATTDKFVRLCEHARFMPLGVALEFGAFTDVPNLEAAAAILELAAQPNQALLVDALHLQRSGGQASRLRDLPTAWFSYAQLCDAPLSGPPASDRAAIRTEAVDARLCPGAGELPLRAMIEALPAGLPLSVEVRSRQLRDGYPDFAARAQVVQRLTRQWLEHLDR
jgi:sugar phosphate isomerase/epimerase